jgi:3-hydroxybutyryl-CoA dehydrogenase
LRAGKVTDAEREATLARISFTTELGDLADRDVVVEAVLENEREKSAVFTALGQIVSPECLLASNTSSIPIMKETVRRAEEFAEQGLGKQTVLCKDRAGFVVNALLIPFLLAAIRMVESGFASPGDVDTAMVAGCAHPMGPLALAI